MRDVAFLIPSRNEEFLNETIDDLIAHCKSDYEIIVVLDGAPAVKPIPQHERVSVVILPESIGQRAATNLAARISNARYVAKVDSHCGFDQDFDLKLISAGDTLGHDVTQVPAMLNWRAFNWKCQGCGKETYQGPEPTGCSACMGHGTTGGPFERVMYWDDKAGGVPGRRVRSDFWRLDPSLLFQYFGEFKNRPEAKDDIVDVMTSIGCCFFMRRERFFELGGLDEAAGSYGQFGAEIALKSWLSGGRHVVNRGTYIGHLFRTQRGFGFPWKFSGTALDATRKYSRDMWMTDSWPGQVRPLSWLIERFAPLPGWHTPSGADVLAQVNASGEAFYAAKRIVARHAALLSSQPSTEETTTDEPIQTEHQQAAETEQVREPEAIRAEEHVGPAPEEKDPRILSVGVQDGGGAIPTKGIIFYSDCRPDPFILDACRRQLKYAAGEIPIVSCTLKPVDLGLNVVLPLERGYLTMAKQILVALEMSTADIVYFCEHDCVYDASHFEFTPEREDTFYYNQHTVKVRADDGHALFYLCNQLSGMCAYRQLALEYYRKRVARLQKEGFSRNMGHEPGTRSVKRGGVMDAPYASWMSEWPNVDIRHSANLTKSRWRRDDFRDQRYCQGWAEGNDIRGWCEGIIKGRFTEWLTEVTTHD